MIEMNVRLAAQVTQTDVLFRFRDYVLKRLRKEVLLETVDEVVEGFHSYVWDGLGIDIPEINRLQAEAILLLLEDEVGVSLFVRTHPGPRAQTGALNDVIRLAGGIEATSSPNESDAERFGLDDPPRLREVDEMLTRLCAFVEGLKQNQEQEEDEHEITNGHDAGHEIEDDRQLVEALETLKQNLDDDLQRSARIEQEVDAMKHRKMWMEQELRNLRESLGDDV